MSRFSVKSFLFHITKTFRRGTIQCFMIFGYQKNLCLRGDFHDFLQKKLFSHSTEKLRRGTFVCSIKSLVTKIFMDKRWGMKEGGVSRKFVEKFLSQSTEKIRKATFQCSTKGLVSKKFMVRSGGGGGGKYHDYLSCFCCLTVPKNFVGELFCVSQSFWYRNSLCIRGGRTEGVS